MSEKGCLKDGNFQNLHVEGVTLTSGTTLIEGTLRASKLLQSSACANTTPTVVEDGVVLVVNTFYKSIATALASSLPDPAVGKIGDFINIFYDTKINHGIEHSYTVNDEDDDFSPGSTCQRIGGKVDSFGSLSSPDDITLTITGNTNGDGGVGTSIRFVNITGLSSGWAVEAITYGQGGNTEDGTIAFG